MSYKQSSLCKIAVYHLIDVSKFRGYPINIIRINNITFDPLLIYINSTPIISPLNSISYILFNVIHNDSIVYYLIGIGITLQHINLDTIINFINYRIMNAIPINYLYFNIFNTTVYDDLSEYQIQLIVESENEPLILSCCNHFNNKNRYLLFITIINYNNF